MAHGVDQVIVDEKVPLPLEEFDFAVRDQVLRGIAPFVMGAVPIFEIVGELAIPSVTSFSLNIE
jgi:hypothetical protein